MGPVVTRIAAAALALGLLFGGVLVAVEIALAGMGRGPWVVPYDDWYVSGRRNEWSSPSSRWLFMICAALGLGLLLLQATRRPPKTLPLVPGRSQGGVSRRSLEQSLARAARNVDGVSSAQVQIRRGRTRVAVSTTRRQPGELQTEVAAVATARMQGLQVADMPRVSVEVRRKARR